MSDSPDRQSEIIEQLKILLAGVPSFGAEVVEDSVLGVFDSEDDSLPDDLIILQETATEEGERTGTASCKEKLSLSIVPTTKRRNYMPLLRKARLDIKRALKGVKAGLTVPGVVTVSWPAETPLYPRDGRRFASRVIPLEITYTQPL
ncbi:hypothetical protein M2318_005319 [Metapseudomonas resinovorans]|uniref:hypothetical protein n=1 Tax=Metapseudomonas resinovorans TaxID=53412 RepID=UPI003D19BBFB